MTHAHRYLLDCRDVAGVAGRGDQGSECCNAWPHAARHHGLIHLKRAGHWPQCHCWSRRLKKLWEGPLDAPALQLASGRRCRRLSTVRYKTQCPARCRRQHPTSLPAVAAPARRCLGSSLGAKRVMMVFIEGHKWDSTRASLQVSAIADGLSPASPAHDGPSPTAESLLWHRPPAMPAI